MQLPSWQLIVKYIQSMPMLSFLSLPLRILRIHHYDWHPSPHPLLSSRARGQEMGADLTALIRRTAMALGTRNAERGTIH